DLSLKSNVIVELQVAFYSHDGVCGIAAPWDERNVRGEGGSAPKGQHSSQMQNGFEFEPHVSVQPIGKLVALPPATARRTMIGLCIIAACPLSRLDTPTKWSDDPLVGPGTGLTPRRINLLARRRRTPATVRDIKMRRTATSLLHRSSHLAGVPA